MRPALSRIPALTEVDPAKDEAHCWISFDGYQAVWDAAAYETRTAAGKIHQDYRGLVLAYGNYGDSASVRVITRRALNLAVTSLTGILHLQYQRSMPAATA